MLPEPACNTLLEYSTNIFSAVATKLNQTSLVSPPEHVDVNPVDSVAPAFEAFIIIVQVSSVLAVKTVAVAHSSFDVGQKKKVESPKEQLPS